MLKDRTLTMSNKEINRCEILKMADEKQITQCEGAKRIDVTERHFRRLLHNYRGQGAEGILSGHRGKSVVIECQKKNKKRFLEN